MPSILRLLLVLLLNLFVQMINSQELNAEVSNARLPLQMASTAAVYDGKDSIYIIGGIDSNGVVRREIFEFSLMNETLTPIALLPFSRDSGAVIIDDQGENIYYFGGDDGDTARREIYKFNLLTKSVTRVGNLTFSTYGHATIKYNYSYSSKVFLIGGFPTSNSIQCWDIELSNCPTKDIDTNFYPAAAAVSYGNEAFVFGNANVTFEADPVYKINLDTFETSLGKQFFPDFRYANAAVVAGSNSYVIGGWRNQTNFPANSIMQVDLNSLNVTVLQVTNFIDNELYISGTSAVYVEKLNRIYVIGGESFPFGYHDEIWFMDLTPNNHS